MAINYDFFETNGVNGPKGKFRAKAISNGTVSTDKLVREMHKANSITEADARGFLAMLTDTVAGFLSDGYDVQVGDLGYFSVSVTSPLVDSPKEIRAESIRFRHINFRPGARFRKLVMSTKILREGNIFGKRKQVTTTPKQRAEKLKEHLEENLCISRIHYMRLTGLTKNVAVNELKDFISQGWLRKYGMGKTVVYLLKKE